MNLVKNGYKKRQRQYVLLVLILLAMLLAAASFSMLYGNTIYSPEDIVRVLLGDNIKGATFTIRTLRFPRMLAGILCGAAFGMAGNTFQKLLGNPLASPDIIGVTSGSSLAAVFGILILHLDGTIVQVMAVISGIAVAVFIYFMSGGAFSNGKLILIGIGAQAFLNALISWLLLKASEYDVANALRFLSGSLNGTDSKSIPALLAVVLAAGGILAALNRHLGILQLGGSYAELLGLNLSKTRLLLILGALFLTAFATAQSGPIASVAFLAGPIASRIARNGQTNLLLSAIVGSLLVICADLIGQYAFSVRYPVGVITGILGAPYLLYLLIRYNRKGSM